MEWYSELSKDLVDVAYKAGNEMAWSRQDAIRVIEILEAAGYVILGVDVWLPTRPGPTIPTPYVYDWSAESRGSSPGYPNSAAEFIKSFVWDPTDKSRGREPYFNLTVDTQRVN
jgi:hypothetical protein